MQPMLTVAVKAARAAGAVINRASADLEKVKVSRKALNDFVTEVDQMSEQVIIETLLEAYPQHGIHAEESGRVHGNSKSDYVWIIDPLDGTTNFIHGLPIYCVSIAMAYRGQVQHAVVYDPTRNDLFTASRGSGAFMNNRRMRVSKRIRLADSLIGTGFLVRAGEGEQFATYLKLFQTIAAGSVGLRRPGAAALDLAYVAAGFYDGFFELGLHPWDMAAGSLLVTEAGGLVGNFRGEANFLEQREILAGTPRVYGELIKILAPHSTVEAEVAPSMKSAKPRVIPKADRPVDHAPPKEHKRYVPRPGEEVAPVEPERPARAPRRIRKDEAPF
jgi:myo-inositol-1(or 4)-monophosphatase